MTAITQEMVVTPLLSLSLVEVEYSPALLLDAHLDASITDQVCFREACEEGFSWYVEELYGLDEQGNEVLFDRRYTWAEVKAQVRGEVVRRYDAGERFFEHRCGFFPSLAWRSGFVLGWLSALALVQRDEALMGCELLVSLVPVCQYQEASRASRGAGGVIGGDGWPLDL